MKHLYEVVIHLEVRAEDKEQAHRLISHSLDMDGVPCIERYEIDVVDQLLEED